MRIKNILGRKEKVSIENISSDFVSLASHQLRTPLSAIKWDTEILLSGKPGQMTPKQLDYLHQIYRSTERAISLVNDLLDVSRIQEGAIHLELRPTRVEDVVEETVDSFETLIKAGNINVNFQVINGPVPKVETDEEKLKRIMMNLLSNAIKYTPAGGKISVAVERFADHLKISVTDSGVGIAREDQEKIFSRFFRSPKILKLAPDGTGLGLFIARSLVEAMGGKIGFLSQEGKGSTFYFILPYKE